MAVEKTWHATAPSGAPVVLVATPDPADRDFLSSLVEAAGCEVCFALDGQDALRKVLLKWPALIVLDLDLPFTDAWEFLRIMSEYPHLSKVPVLVISGGSPHEGDARRISRPFVPERVRETVTRLCGILDRTA
jgi:CheY-like chemotaxis protein